MKKIFTFCAIALLFSRMLPAQDNVIKFNPLSLIVATYQFAYERVIGDKTALQLGIYYTGYKFTDTKIAGIGLVPEIRFYLQGEKKAPHGFYLAPFLRYSSLSLTQANLETGTDDKATLTTIGGGAVIGIHSLYANNKLSWDVFIGPSYSSLSWKVTSGEQSEFSTGSLGGFGIRLGTTIGFAF